VGGHHVGLGALAKVDHSGCGVGLHPGGGDDDRRGVGFGVCLRARRWRESMLQIQSNSALSHTLNIPTQHSNPPHTTPQRPAPGVVEVVHRRHQRRQDLRPVLLLDIRGQVRAHLPQRLARGPAHARVGVVQALEAHPHQRLQLLQHHLGAALRDLLWCCAALVRVGGLAFVLVLLLLLFEGGLYYVGSAGWRLRRASGVVKRFRLAARFSRLRLLITL